MLGIPIVGATTLVVRHQTNVTTSLRHEREGVAAIDRAYAAGCANVSARALRPAIDRSGLSDDVGMAALILDATLLRWPPACAHMRNATLRLVRAGNRHDRHSYTQRVLAFADETLAQAGLLGGAEDEAEGLRAGGIGDDPAAGVIARDVSAFVVAMNRYLAPRPHHPERLDAVIGREQATLRDVTIAARVALGILDDSLQRRIAAAEGASRRAIWTGAAALAAAALLIALVAMLLMRRRRAALGAARDRVERLHAEYDRALALSERDVSESQFTALFEESPTGVALLDRAGAAVRTNPALATILPNDDPSVLGSSHASYGALWTGERSVLGFEASTGDGPDARSFDVSLSPIKSQDGTVLFVMSFVRDITERKRAERLLVHQATHDALTGLPNRTGFHDALRAHLERGRRNTGVSAVFFVDLDDFKLVNDAMGHEAGDAVLVAAGQRLHAQLPDDDVARIGGDEFAVLVKDRPTREAVEQVAQALVAGFIPPLVADWREAFVTAAVGVAFIEHADAPSASSALRDADIAMFHAKRSGRSRYAIFNNEMRDGVLRRSVLVAEMRKALDRGDFVVAFEPVVSLDDGSTFGYEALARWRHPHLGTIAPDEFIPIAEQTGMINPLGEQTLRRTCERLVDWESEGRDVSALRISVNVSVHQLTTSFDERMLALVESYGLDPRNFTLELTESGLLAAGDGSTGAIRKLKRAGFKLSIDDFGTGYSSLGYLQRFPFDELKIDKTFVDGPAGGLAHEPIIAMIVALGRSLGVDVVAEGVETTHQAERLRVLGCARAQGFHFVAAAAAGGTNGTNGTNGQGQTRPAPRATPGLP